MKTVIILNPIFFIAIIIIMISAGPISYPYIIGFLFFIQTLQSISKQSKYASKNRVIKKLEKILNKEVK